MLNPGDRVRIVGDPEWPEGTTGVIAAPEPFMLELAKPGEWQRCRRIVQGVRRPIITYFVLFDSPRDDGSGDGPYRGGEVDEENIQLMTES